MATTEDPKAGVDGAGEWRRELYDAKPERQGELFSTMSGIENEPLYTPDNGAVDYERELGYPGGLSVHPRRLSVDVSRAALDDAPVRGFGTANWRIVHNRPRYIDG